MGLRGLPATGDCCRGQRAHTSRGPALPRQALRRWHLPLSRPPRPQGLARRGVGAQIRNRWRPPRPEPPTRTQGSAPRPGTGRRPAPRLEREGPHRGSGTDRTLPSPQETSLGSRSPVRGAPDPQRKTRRPPPRGLLSPGLACGTDDSSPPRWQPRLPVGARWVPRLPGRRAEAPRATNKRDENGAARARGRPGDFRAGAPCGTPDAAIRPPSLGNG